MWLLLHSLTPTSTCRKLVTYVMSGAPPPVASCKNAFVGLERDHASETTKARSSKHWPITTARTVVIGQCHAFVSGRQHSEPGAQIEHCLFRDTRGKVNIRKARCLRDFLPGDSFACHIFSQAVTRNDHLKSFAQKWAIILGN